MIRTSLLAAAILAVASGVGHAQGTAYSASDPMAQIATQLTAISRSVQTLSERMKVFVDKFEKVGGLTMTEKQQRLVLGMELLMRTEQRVATLQKFQIDLTDKQNEVRSRLTQIENDLRPRNIENSVNLAGTTEAQELREMKQNKLANERVALTNLLQQIQSNLADVNENVREAQAMASRLRRTFLPQIEQEIYGQ